MLWHRRWIGVVPLSEAVRNSCLKHGMKGFFSRALYCHALKEYGPSVHCKDLLAFGSKLGLQAGALDPKAPVVPLKHSLARDPWEVGLGLAMREGARMGGCLWPGASGTGRGRATVQGRGGVRVVVRAHLVGAQSA